MKLYVIRHGNTDSNALNVLNGKLDEDINGKGINQALEAAKIVKDLDIDLIICSPLLRVRHTCNIVNVNNIEVIYDKRIEERDWGTLTNTKIDECCHNEYWNYYSKVKIEGLETVPELFERVHLFLDEIKETYKEKNLLIVTHGGVARAIHFYFNELPKDGQVRKYIPGNCEIKEYELVTE